jgi:hypothetical protein
MSYTRFVAYSVIPLLFLAAGVLDHDFAIISVIGAIAELFVVARMLDRRKAVARPALSGSASDVLQPPVDPSSSGLQSATAAPIHPDSRVGGLMTLSNADESPRGLARPWPRYWARMLDTTLFTNLLALVAGTIWALSFPRSYAEFFQSDNSSYPGYKFIWVLWLLCPLAMVLDASIYCIFGNTPGKALLGIKVRGPDGARLTYRAALRRNFGVYWRGLGTGFPLVGLFTLVHAYNVAAAGKASSWDVTTGSKPIGHGKGYRTWIGAATYMILVVGLQLLDKTSRDGNGRTATSVVTSINEVVTAVNSASPKMLDDETRLDGAEAGPGIALTYLYTLVSVDSRSSEVNREARTEMLTRIRSQYCRGDSLKRFREASVPVHYKYRDRNGLPFTELAVSPADCP